MSIIFDFITLILKFTIGISTHFLHIIFGKLIKLVLISRNQDLFTLILIRNIVFQFLVNFSIFVPKLNSLLILRFPIK